MEGGGKLLSCSQCQELGQRANLDSDWLPENKEPIRSQVSFLTQLLTLTTTQKFPSQISIPKMIRNFTQEFHATLSYDAKKRA